VSMANSLCHSEAYRLSDLIDGRDFPSLFKLIDSLIVILGSSILKVNLSFINNFKKENAILTTI
jgi:hypothetical protein